MQDLGVIIKRTFSNAQTWVNEPCSNKNHDKSSHIAWVKTNKSFHSKILKYLNWLVNQNQTSRKHEWVEQQTSQIKKNVTLYFFEKFQ